VSIVVCAASGNSEHGFIQHFFDRNKVESIEYLLRLIRIKRERILRVSYNRGAKRLMKKQKILITKLTVLTFATLLGLAGVFGPLHSYDKVKSFSSGPPVSVSGAPGEGNCTACHSDFTVNSGKGGVTITGLPATYSPNQEIQVTVTVTQNNTVGFGFQLTAVDAAGAAGGTFTVPVQNPAQMQIITGNVSGNIRSYVEHTKFGIGGGGDRSWTFTWQAPNQDIGPISFYAAGNAVDSDGTSSGDFVYLTSTVIDPEVANTGGTRFDFDGDFKADISVFRRDLGEWWFLRSIDGQDGAFAFGSPTDVPVPADYTGDGIADFSFWRPSTGEWFVLRSDNTGFFSFPFGADGDIPAPGDFDGDGIDDAAVFRPSSGVWFIQRSSDGGTDFVPFGAPNDKPLVGDYDNDGKDDVAIYKPDVGQYWQIRSTEGLRAFAFGAVGDIAMAADFSGDGTDDMIAWRPATGFWFVLRSEDSDFFGFPFGANGDIPAPADYDGDGTADPTVFRPTDTTWYSQQSTNGATFTPFGSATDEPLPATYNAP
jgi:hypothetical protein